MERVSQKTKQLLEGRAPAEALCASEGDLCQGPGKRVAEVFIKCRGCWHQVPLRFPFSSPFLVVKGASELVGLGTLGGSRPQDTHWGRSQGQGLPHGGLRPGPARLHAHPEWSYKAHGGQPVCSQRKPGCAGSLPAAQSWGRPNPWSSVFPSVRGSPGTLWQGASGGNKGLEPARVFMLALPPEPL